MIPVQVHMVVAPPRMLFLSLVRCPCLSSILCSTCFPLHFTELRFAGTAFHLLILGFGSIGRTVLLQALL